MSELNKEQQAVVDSTSSRILCLAGAGAGKTFTMISRIIHQVESGVNPESILVLTFTNAAAFEMKQRYLNRKPANIHSIPEFRTFHSFCYSLLMKDGAILRKLGYTKVPSISDEARTKALLKTAAMQCGINLSQSKISSADLSIKESADKSMLMKALRRLLKQKNLITFDILCYDVCELFSGDSELIKYYKQKYRYVYADEYQDTDPRQNKFLMSFNDSNLMVVGDALQAIYQFRNADSSLIKSLASDKNWTTYKLTHNYRSTKPIVDYANRFSSTYAKHEPYRIEMQTDKAGDSVSTITYNVMSKRNEVAFLEDICKIVIRHGLKNDGDVAVLCRTNLECDIVRKYLTEKGLNVEDKYDAAYYTDIFKASIDDTYLLEFLISKLSSEELSTYIRLTFGSKPLTIQEFMTHFGNSYLVKQVASDVAEVRNIYTQVNTYRSTVTALLEFAKCNALTTDIDTVTLDTYNDVIDYVVNKLNSGVESHLYVGTIHSAKGLEYNTVILPDVNDTSFVLSGEDNLNLYYVGITRAKNNLYVFYRR